LMIGIMVTLKFKLFGFQFIAWYFPFYCIGYFGRKHLLRIEPFLRRMQWLMLALFMAMAWFWMRKDPPMFMPEGSSIIFNYVYKFATAMVGSVAFLTLFKHIANHRVLIISNFLGGNTGLICYTSKCYLRNNESGRSTIL